MISSSTVVTSVVEKLRQALATGRWRTGDMLPGQRELAEQLGISRPSLREAIIVLETLGLVRSMPGKGVVVLDEPLADGAASASAVAQATLGDYLQLRYTLEPFIVGLLAQSISQKETGELRLSLMDLREALEEADGEAGNHAYIAFHEQLFALTANPIFHSMVQQTRSALQQSAQALKVSAEHQAARLGEAEALVRAIRNKDSAGASDLMRQHILQEGRRLNVPLQIPDNA
ncbi:MAG: FCD domain-containing protein [Pseudomonas sp.]|nr:FCD domain-containing protein [Pseudomonas sp.]